MAHFEFFEYSVTLVSMGNEDRQIKKPATNQEILFPFPQERRVASMVLKDTFWVN